jgi:hypothetical protein
LFIGAWLGGWVMGEFFALGMVTGLFGGKGPANLFILFWLIGWTVGGFFAFRMFLWNLIGKEIITIGQGNLAVAKKGALLFKAKTYDLNEVKNIRAQEDNLGLPDLLEYDPADLERSIRAERSASTTDFRR